ncbi:MAG TPA: DUF4276 family protein [Fimbriimonadaceae bacterium]|nr:DUF4276 family protein [Fimbriimonadaceae bacterium]
MKIKVYVEGGGRDNELLRSQCRQGFVKLAEKAGCHGVHFVARGGRDSAYDAFCTALTDRQQDEIILLLVDSEEIVTKPLLWDHMAGRPSNALAKPGGADEEHLFFMAVCMETWLVSDPRTLKGRFGNGFDPSKLPSGPLEQVSKGSVFTALEQATKSCAQKYAKGKLSFELLGSVDASAVRRQCPNAERFFDRLSKHLGVKGP